MSRINGMLGMTAIIILLSGCLSTQYSGANNSTNPSNNQTALANPASQKCIADGGVDKVLYNSSGQQYGVCLFNDGSVCDEWAYYSGQCRKGECMRTCKFVG